MAAALAGAAVNPSDLSLRQPGSPVATTTFVAVSAPLSSLPGFCLWTLRHVDYPPHQQKKSHQLPFVSSQKYFLYQDHPRALNAKKTSDPL